MTNTNRIRTNEDALRFKLGLAPIDQAFFASEQKWGVGRLERLVSPSTLASYARGWDAYRAALDASDPDAIAEVGPKMIAALNYMDSEATKAGHQPLDPCVWEIELGNTGTVLVLTRTQFEQSHLIRAAHAKGATTFTAGAGGGLQATNGAPLPETTLPVDVALSVRDSHEGRAIEVWTIGEVAALILRYGSVARDSRKWQGSPAHSGQQLSEGAPAEIVRSGFPLDSALAMTDELPKKVVLDF